MRSHPNHLNRYSNIILLVYLNCFQPLWFPLLNYASRHGRLFLTSLGFRKYMERPNDPNDDPSVLRLREALQTFCDRFDNHANPHTGSDDFSEKASLVKIQTS